MDPSLETALAALRQLKLDRQNGLLTDRDYDRRVAALLQGQNAPALLAQLQADGSLPATPPGASGPPPAAPAPFVPAVAAAATPAPNVPPVPTGPPATPLASVAFGGLPLPAPVPEPMPSALEDEAATELAPLPKPSSALTYVLIGGGLLVLVLLIAYLLMGKRPSEHLTSTSRTGADSAAVIETGPQAAQIVLPPAAAPETIRVAPSIPPAAARPDSAVAAPSVAPKPAVSAPAPPAADSAAAPAPAASPSASTAPMAPDAAAEQQVRTALASYYDDLHAAPFDASAHFAPTVERFLTLANTTPAIIASTLDHSHFPEFQDYQASIAPGSLRMSAPAADGSRTVTYIEVGRSFRQSLQQHQRTRTQVRVRLTPDFKIAYLRQEKMLENTLLP